MTDLIALSLVCHLVGDYLLQNDWMANKKTSNTFVALLHATLYSIPFYFLLDFGYPLLIIMITHFFIDRFRLATYFIKLVNWNWESKNFGYNDDKPLWMSVWLMIIIDNVLHVTINTFTILFV